MWMSEYHHESIIDQVTNSLVRSATSHSVGALMRGHSILATIAIAALVIFAVWIFKRVF